MKFIDFRTAVQRQFDILKDNELFCVEVDRDLLYTTYLNSFPDGTNNVFRERTEHDCNCCKNFIRDIGQVVAVVDGKLKSIWDVEIGGYYQVVADTMSEIVKSLPISGVYRHRQCKVGVDKTHGDHDGTIETWNHFYQKLPNKFVISDGTIASFRGNVKTNKTVLETSLNVITLEAAEIVSDLIDQNSLYRGKEFKHIVSAFKSLKREYNSIEKDKELFLWIKSTELKEGSRIKNTVIGTLLFDLSEGVPLEDAVRMFESKVAPTNYKRSSALITQGMIDKANEKVVELGLEDSLQRRFAVTEDVTVNNVLFANRDTKKVIGGAMDKLSPTKRDKTPNLDKVQEITIESFIGEVLPQSNNLELMIENNHENSFMSLIAPSEADATPLFKWDNAFSWSYNGEVTDSIKERVKAAGGSVTGDLRCSLSWFNYDDLDIHLIEPNGNRIMFNNMKSRDTGGHLDVDMNAGGRSSRNAVENITFPNKDRMLEGQYHLIIHNYNKRESDNVGFMAEMEFAGNITVFEYAEAVPNRAEVPVATFEYSHKSGIKIIKSLPSNTMSKEVWNINTCKWTKVNMVMSSPNHWDGQTTGNKHWFFILEGCENPDNARGFYNEFLRNDLIEHRKVFEVLSSKLKAAHTENQLSGVGFSSTNKNSLLCKVSGSFNRVVKINF